MLIAPWVFSHPNNSFYVIKKLEAVKREFRILKRNFFYETLARPIIEVYNRNLPQVFRMTRRSSRLNGTLPVAASPSVAPSEEPGRLK
jgi:hypothetical protein